MHDVGLTAQLRVTVGLGFGLGLYLLGFLI